IFSWLGAIPERILPAPTEVVKSAIQLSATGDLVNHVSVSLGRAFIGFVLGGAIGFIFGLLNGVFRLSEVLFDTSIQMLSNISHLALIPQVILWFGIDEWTKIFLDA